MNNNVSHANPGRAGNWVPIVVFAFLAASLFWLRSQGRQVGTKHPGVGTQLSGISLQPLTADRPITDEALAGKVVMINFWATWCGPCRSEFPHLVQIQHRLADDDRFQFVSISCPTAGTQMAEFRASTTHFAQRHEARFDIHFDPASKTHQRIAGLASVGSLGIPLTVVLDQQSVVRGVWQGFRSGDERAMEALVHQLLE